MTVKKSIFLLGYIFVWLSFNSHAQSSSLAFDITPKDGTLPTEVLPGQTTTAYYTVKDLTGGPPPHAYNYVKHLPKNVSQVTSDSSVLDLCGKTFVLSAYGTCTLELEISGVVSSDCDDSENPCLFVCMDDGFTCAGTKYPLEVTLAALPVLGGQYNTPSNQFPMLAANTTSDGNNDQWEYTIDANGPLPNDLVYSDGFSGTSCTGETCVAVGGYLADDGNTYPMIALSNNSGENWKYVINSQMGLPVGYDNFASFNNVSCSGKICVASGQFQSNDNLYPLLAVSTNTGAQGSWNYVNTLSTPSNSTNGIFNSTSCEDNVCIAGGQYQINAITYPILAVNTNITGNGSWQYVINNQQNLPSDFTNAGNFWSVSCAKNVCIAGGEYNHYPLVAINNNVNDNGSWDYVISSAHLPSDCSMGCTGEIQGASCSGNTCVAGGNYNNGSAPYPLLAVSTNVTDSDTWSYAVDSTTHLPSEYSNNGSFYAISCAEEVCAAAGQYDASNGVIYPMLTVNTTAGSGNWDYVVEINLNLPSAYENGGSFYGVTCDANLCMAVGYYTDEDAEYYPLMILNSEVTGLGSWEYPIDSEQGPLPSDFAGYGLFCGTTAVCDE